MHYVFGFFNLFYGFDFDITHNMLNTSTTHFDLLALLFSGLAMEVMLRVAPALRFAYRNPLLCLARVAILWGLAGLAGNAVQELHSITWELACAAVAHLSDALRSPSLLADLVRLGSRAIIGLLLLGSAFCLAGQGFTTLARYFRRHTKDSEILESERDQASPYRSSGPVTRKVLRVDDEVPCEAEANVTSVTITVSELRRLLSTNGTPENQIRSEPDALPRRGTPKKRPITRDPRSDSPHGSTPVANEGQAATGVAAQSSERTQPPLTNATISGREEPKTTSSGPAGLRDARPTESYHPWVDPRTRVEGQHHGTRPGSPQFDPPAAAPHAGCINTCTRCRPPCSEEERPKWADESVEQAFKPGEEFTTPREEFMTPNRPSNYGCQTRPSDETPEPVGIPEPYIVERLLPTSHMALEWLSDDPHAYDWALLEGSFSAYESPPPPGVYFTYPSLRYEAVVCSSGWDKDRPSPRNTAREPGLFPDEARYQNLRKLRSDFHSQDRFLSEEEKTLDLSQLHRKWKDEAQRRAHLRGESRPTDWDDLGNLEPEMKQWTKAAIRCVIWTRKQERWLKRMRQLNIPIHTCEDCSRQVTSSHRCIPTGLAIPTIRDTPYGSKELVVSQQGGNLTLKPKDVVVPDKLRGEIEKMSTLPADKETLAAQQKHLIGTLTRLTRVLNAERRFGTPQHEPPLVIPKTTTMTPARTNFGTSLPAAGGAPPLTQSTLLGNRTPERRTSPRISSALQYLTLSQGRREYYGLVDTGSQINLIDVDLMPTLRHEEVLPATGGATEFRGSTGGNTPILGWAVLTFCLPTGEAVTTPYAVVCLSSSRVTCPTRPPRGFFVPPVAPCA
ncbi:MAG: hypothetical protein KVP17_001034 [Porospora cf. gigantea B]|uniref:uncharacterized protein n=1 Tax=Porospora cf. gigantea B TaxID=2853592 RepID=UPI003571F0C5|nr:MAG: hypothetical protein KVP17_001034 [Porospora cf. gigantea B]